MTRWFGALLLSGLLGCAEPPAEAPAQVVRPVRIHTFTGSGGDLVLSYSGTVSARLRSEMGFEVPGRISELLVVAGDEVDEGEVLARIDDTDYRATLASARAEFNRAQTEYERYRVAYEGDAVTQQEVDLRLRDAEVARASLEIAEKGLADTELRAIFAGRVARIIASDFANVQAKEPVLVLQDDASLEIEVDVPERDWVRARPEVDLAEGLPLARPVVELPALPGRTFPARFAEADSAADPVTRTYAVSFAFDRPDDVRLQPGMTGRLVLSLPEELQARAGEDTSARIPAVAVAADASGAPYVWRIGEDMRVSRQAVSIGEITGEEVVLLDGLQPGDRIATSGVHQLREGMTVRGLGG